MFENVFVTYHTIDQKNCGTVIAKGEFQVIKNEKTANIGTRLWLFKWTPSGLSFAKSSGGDDGYKDWEYFETFLKKLEDGNSALLKPAGFTLEKTPELKNEEEKKSTVVRGFYADGTEDVALSMCERWLDEVALRTRSNSPCLFFSRNRLESVPATVFTATSCIDMVFAMAYFKEYSWFYRDADRMIAAIKIKKTPDLQDFKKKWRLWSSRVNILAHSPRFLFVEKNDVVALYTMGVSSSTMQDIKKTGMSWQRTAQLWSAPVERTDMGAVFDLILKDSLPDPSVLGYMPEWYFSKGAAVKPKGKSDLWKVLFDKK